MEQEDMKAYLRRAGLISRGLVVIEPLKGGVSSDIHLVSQGDKQFVVKQALAKLRVKDDWYAPVSRNQVEQEYLRYVGKILPEAVPEILHADPEKGLFIMEYLGGEYGNWKALLLQKRIDSHWAVEAARTLGTIHKISWDDKKTRDMFDTTRNFFDLRLEPYLLATGKRHPFLRDFFEAESKRISETRVCLVHGDYSPKNMLIGGKRLVILDCEVAWYGDPAFDVAFLLNHFLLKSLHLYPHSEPFLDLIAVFMDQYRNILEHRFEEIELEQRISHLLSMLFLARIDGKSPAEYITDDGKKDLVRRFATRIVPQTPATISDLVNEWRTLLFREMPLMENT